MAFDISSSQFISFIQNLQNRFIKIDLLNYQFQTVNSLEGVCISGNISIDANSDLRRSGNVSLVIQKTDFQVEPGGQIWLDKYLKVWVGIENTSVSSIKNKVKFIVNQSQLLPTENLKIGDIAKVIYDSDYNNNTTYYRCTSPASESINEIWTCLGEEISYINCGIYIIDAPNYNFDMSTNTLSLNLLDLMAKLTGVRNGYLPGTPVVLSAGENIRQTIIDTLALGGFTKYVVEEAPSPGTIPNDIEFGQGSTVYDLLSGLKDIYPNYEMFFDTEGVFYYKPIPTGSQEPVTIDDSLWSNIVISEQIDVDFQNVKNVIEVYGRTHDPAHFSTETTVSSSGAISLTIADVTEYTENMIYGFTLTDNPGYTAPTLKINNLTSYPILMSDGETAAEIVAEESEIYYCVEFKGTYWNWMGHLQSYGYAEDDNPQSPFYVNSSVGKISLPLFDDDYSNCITDDLAQQRANYELWLHTNMNNTIQLTCVPVPFLDVNILVEYTNNQNKQTNQYIIKSIDFGLAPEESMTLTMIQFYPEYSNI